MNIGFNIPSLIVLLAVIAFIFTAIKTYKLSKRSHSKTDKISLKGEIKMSDSHELLFINPELRPGYNVTVRKGPKWYGRDNSDIYIFKTGDLYRKNLIAKGKIIRTSVKRFKEITEQDLIWEHDSDCMTIEGLTKAMERAYARIHPDDIITIVEFNVSL